MSACHRFPHRSAAFFQGRSVAITGAAGSIGRELVQQLLRLGVSRIRALDNDENGLFELHSAHSGEPRLDIAVCNVAVSERLRHVFNCVDFVFHAAAMKHVPICEETPLAAVDVNIGGVANVIDAALGSGVKRIIFTSSDKAVHPTNVMGASKLVGERIAIAANKRNGTTVIACTRFGNVAGSRGSVLPVFCKQIAAGGPVTLTSPDMTRFFMTKEVAVALVVQSMVHARGGEVFVTKMQAIRIGDLADVMIRLLAPLMGQRPEQIPIEVIGPRPGEKLYEELVSEEELTRTFAVDDYLISQPLRHGGVDDEDTVVYAGLGTAARAARPYNSQLERPLARAEIEAFLTVNGLLPDLPGRVAPTLFAAQ